MIRAKVIKNCTQKKGNNNVASKRSWEKNVKNVKTFAFGKTKYV
jgi:hypothetical protein